MQKQKLSQLFQADEGQNATSKAGWISGTLNRGELLACEFQDTRVGQRFCKLVRQLAGKVGQTIPLASQDWTNTKAAYRFLSNRRVNEAGILAGHFQATQERVAAASGPILVLHDTTEFTYSRESLKAIGMLKTSYGMGPKKGVHGSIPYAAF